MFQRRLVEALRSPDIVPNKKLFADLVISQFNNILKKFAFSNQIAKYKVEWTYHPPLSETPISLNELIKLKGIYLERFRITLITEHENTNEFELVNPNNINWDEVILKKEKKRKIYKHIFRIYSFLLHTEFLKIGTESLINSCDCPPEMLVPYIEQPWDWFLRFMCKICGKLYFCECFENAFNIYNSKINAEPKNSLPGNTLRFKQVVREPIYRKGICHICRIKSSDIHYCDPMYGSDIMVHYGPYIVRTAVEKGITQHDAENEIRDILGIPHIGEGWISEVELLNIIQDLYPSENIIHHSRPDWLNGKHLDIFLPNQKLAIEYQGLQHYMPVDFFGGEQAFYKIQERDKSKAESCAKNGITLIYFRFDERITKEIVKKRISKYHNVKAGRE